MCFMALSVVRFMLETLIFEPLEKMTILPFLYESVTVRLDQKKKYFQGDEIGRSATQMVRKIGATTVGFSESE